MSQKLSRRSFLKTAGAVAVAAAAMSTLTACGGLMKTKFLIDGLFL